MRSNRGEKTASNQSSDKVRRTYRLTVHQPLSVVLPKPTVTKLNVGKVECSFFVHPNHDDPSTQRMLGGSTIQAEYSLSDESDLIRALSSGLQLVEDFLTGLSIVAGIPFESCSPVQIVDITDPEKARFVLFVDSEHKHWPGVTASETLEFVAGVIAHWDGLPKGDRIRRAARLYRQALGSSDEIATFQAAYMGLESLEPLLAEMIGVAGGYEEVQGKCEQCGFEYTKRRTTLNAVRAYVRGEALQHEAVTHGTGLSAADSGSAGGSRDADNGSD